MKIDLPALLFPMLTQWLRGRPLDAGSITLHRKRIYILPTQRGWFFALLLLLLLLGSLNYALSLGFVLTFLLAGLGQVAMLHTYRNLRDIQIRAGDVPPVFCGNNAQFHLLLQAPGVRPAIGLHFKQQTPQWLDLLEPGEQGIALPCPAQQRGWLKPGRVTVFTNFPLGLFRAWAYVDFGQRCLVYPQPAENPPRDCILPALETQGASHTLDQQQDGAEDFHALREYRVGDAPRHIAWKASSKNEILLTKQFSASAPMTFWLDWQALPDTDLETRLSQLTALVLEADRQQHQYGLRLPGNSIAPGHGNAHREACLKALALFGHADA